MTAESLLILLASLAALGFLLVLCLLWRGCEWLESLAKCQLASLQQAQVATRILAMIHDKELPEPPIKKAGFQGDGPKFDHVEHIHMIVLPSVTSIGDGYEVMGESIEEKDEDDGGDDEGSSNPGGAGSHDDGL